MKRLLVSELGVVFETAAWVETSHDGPGEDTRSPVFSQLPQALG